MPVPAVTTETPFWEPPLSALLEQLVASSDGLSSEEAALRLTRFGPNLIHGERKRVQILLNNLLYDVSELPIPLDRVDDDYLSHPRHWDMKFIRNFMLVIGPVSSIFDFLTFYIMLAVFHAGEALFHTGWFIESMATQVLVIFIIRTRKNPFKSRPNPWLVACSLSVLAVAVLLPFTSAGVYLGFVAPPVFFFLILTTMLIAYLLAVEGMKRWFFRRFAAE